jgi:hypothetical protein
MSISPLRAPEAHHPDQLGMFAPVVDTSFATPEHPHTMTLQISLHRTPRQKCTSCGHRRVCFFIGLGTAITGPSLCAKCFGIR